MVNVKKVKKADLSKLVKLYLKSYKDLKEYAERDEDGAYNYLLWLYNNCQEYFFKAELDGKIIGFITFDPHWNRSGRRNLEIHEIVVDPKYRNRGVGSILIKKALDIGTKEGNKEAALWVGRKNLKAIEWYKKLGFYKVGEWGKWLRFRKRLL